MMSFIIIILIFNAGVWIVKGYLDGCYLRNLPLNDYLTIIVFNLMKNIGTKTTINYETILEHKKENKKYSVKVFIKEERSE